MSVKIKICGLTRIDDAHSVNGAGPDYAGFVFCEKSRRNITLETAQALRGVIRPDIKTVGVFVNAPAGRIAAIYRQGIVDVVQLHGEESGAYIAGLRELLPNAEIWKAYTVRGERDLIMAAESEADRVLLDNGCGTGRCFAWSLLQGFPRPFILAGGLTPENLTKAIGRLRPFGVDISSGVETDGKKDRDKIHAATAAVRGSQHGFYIKAGNR